MVLYPVNEGVITHVGSMYDVYDIPNSVRASPGGRSVPRNRRSLIANVAKLAYDVCLRNASLGIRSYSSLLLSQNGAYFEKTWRPCLRDGKTVSARVFRRRFSSRFSKHQRSLKMALRLLPLSFDTTRPVLCVPAVFRTMLSLKPKVVGVSCFARGSGDPTSRKRFTKASTHIVFVTIFAAQGFCAPVRSISGSV